MTIATRVRAGRAVIKEGLLDIFQRPVTNPFLGQRCQWHQQTPKECGLFLSKNPTLADLPHFVYCFGHDLPAELRRHIYAYLFPPRAGIDKIVILDDNRKQSDDRTYGETFCEIQAIVEIFHRLSKGQIEIRGNITDERKKNVARMKWAARKVVPEMLQYLGQVLLPRLKCHELTDANLPIDSPKLARIWLGSLAPLAPHLESLTLGMAVTRWYDVVDKNETVRLCNYIAANFPKLKRFGLYLHLSRSEINRDISHPNRLCWVPACRLLMARMGVNYDFFLTEINESNEAFEDWNDRYRTETPWEMFDDQIRQYNTAYWRTHVLDDEHRILHQVTLPENRTRK